MTLTILTEVELSNLFFLFIIIIFNFQLLTRRRSALDSPTIFTFETYLRNSDNR